MKLAVSDATCAHVQQNELGFLAPGSDREHYSAHSFKDFYLERIIRFG